MKKIAFISQPLYFRSMYGASLDKSFIVKEFPSTIFDCNYDALLDFNADYDIFFRGEYVPKKVLDQLSGTKIALSSEPFPRYIDGHWDFTVDSLRRYAEFRNIRDKSYDYVFQHA